MEDDPKKIRVFPLADPQDWIKNQDAIKKTILAAINPGLPGFLNVKHSFSIDSVSNWIRYNLGNDLWNERPKRSLPQSAEEATQAAKKFIADLQQQCLGKDYLKLEIPPVLPTENLAKIEHLATSPVFHFDKPWVDHWLCRFEVSLRPFQDSESFESVYGSSIDIRIGQKGKVVSLISQWRPVWLVKNTLAEFISLPESDHYEAGDHEAGDHEAGDQGTDHHEMQLVYELDGENCPQTFLTPKYISLSGHHGALFPASTMTLYVTLRYAQKTEGGAYILPYILGGSGEYILHWAYWQPDKLWDDGLISLGEQEYIELSQGVYNIMLHIEDKKERIVSMIERMVFINNNEENNSELIS